MKTQPARVVLVEDHILVRRALGSLLQGMAGIQVVGEAADARDALRLVRELKPDVVLMGSSMPNLNGLDATAPAVTQSPAPRVIILSMHSGQRDVMEAMRAGAAGHLLKTCETEEMRRAIRTLAAAGKYLTPAVSAAIMDAFGTGAGQARRSSAP